MMICFRIRLNSLSFRLPRQPNETCRWRHMCFIRYVKTHYMSQLSHYNTLIFFVRIGNNLLWIPPCAHTKQLGRTHQKACQVIRVQFALVFYVQLSSECNLPINDICCVLDGGKRASTQLLKVATADPI